MDECEGEQMRNCEQEQYSVESGIWPGRCVATGMSVALSSWPWSCGRSTQNGAVSAVVLRSMTAYCAD